MPIKVVYADYLAPTEPKTGCLFELDCIMTLSTVHLVRHHYWRAVTTLRATVHGRAVLGMINQVPRSVPLSPISDCSSAAHPSIITQEAPEARFNLKW